MFHIDAFYNEMLEKINNVEVLMHNKIIQEKELKKAPVAYNKIQEKIENIDNP